MWRRGQKERMVLLFVSIGLLLQVGCDVVPRRFCSCRIDKIFKIVDAASTQVFNIVMTCSDGAFGICESSFVNSSLFCASTNTIGRAARIVHFILGQLCS